jgi:chitinase domain-containing protein 1
MRSRRRLQQLFAAASSLLLLAAASAAPEKQQQQEEELRLCSEDALSDLAWADRGDAETLGFVTPWNSQGYAVAESHGSKFTYISPVWYQIRASEEGGAGGGGGGKLLVLTGGHDVDGEWIARVRAAGASCAADAKRGAGGGGGVKIVPRVLWEVNALLTQAQVLQVVLLISREFKSRAYDGVVLEFPIDPGAAILAAFTASLRKALPPGSETIIVAIPAFQSPMRGGPAQLQVTPQALARLERQGVDRFLAMCYDAVEQSGRTNSPLGFVRATVGQLAGGEAVVRRKMLVSLPWYGYDNGHAIVRGHEVVRRLLQGEGVVPGSMKMEWSDTAEELVFEYMVAGETGSGRQQQQQQEQHVGTYPSPEFFRRRLQLVKEEGMAGMAIWELGQGLPCFPRLL